jgi:cation diffusion facilitator CzcD-associated flavoprotein CzcO
MITRTDHVDMLIVGAGISGIGAACHLRREQPGKSYAILEARDAIGGTWDLFRYPGIRSDSDLHTFGYAFKPWTDDKAIADGDSILAYIRETAQEYGVDEHIRFGHRVLAASWSSDDALWTVSGERDGEPFTMTARWLFCASGYYRYDEGFTPQFEGTDRFQGRIVHPQHWPEDLDYAGKRVVVIGSGATAMTLVPAMARDAAHVTMLQRSPTYVLPLPARDALANRLRKLLGEERAYAVTRRKNIVRQLAFYRLCRRFPRLMRRVIRRINAHHLPASVPVDVHFKPRYDPWDQRLCVVPDADLYHSLHGGRASVVTDHIDTFTERGIRLRSGAELEADVIVTATGLNLLLMGGIELTVDGEAVTPSETVVYKGMMLSGVPNFALAVGYTNASWTLKVDLVCEHFLRLIAHAEAEGKDAFVPELADPEMPTQPLLDFQAGYVLRALEHFPKQGQGEPWHLAQQYFKDVAYLKRAPVTDDELRFFSAARVERGERPAALAA